MPRSHKNERGAALVETALALPVLLLALYGVVWGVRVGLVTERAEEVIRYSGVLQQQQNPFVDYSLYTLYNNLNGESNVHTQSCPVPNEGFLRGGQVASVPGAPVPGPFGAFFVPTSVNVSCTTPKRIALNSGFLRPYLMLTQSPVVDADVSATFVGVLPGAAVLGTHHVSRSMPFYRSPDLASLLHCSPQLSAVITASLQPATDGSAPGVSLPLTVADGTPLSFTSNCNAGSGAPVPIPSQSPFVPTPAPTPSAIATGKLPTPPPTTAPTSAPTHVPTAAPTAAPTGGPSTSAPTAAPSAKPSPTASPTVAPTKSPTPKPTATPTPKPTASPTPKPSPTPTPQPPSGPVS